MSRIQSDETTYESATTEWDRYRTPGPSPPWIAEHGTHIADGVGEIFKPNLGRGIAWDVEEVGTVESFLSDDLEFKERRRIHGMILPARERERERMAI